MLIWNSIQLNYACLLETKILAMGNPEIYIGNQELPVQMHTMKPEEIKNYILSKDVLHASTTDL